MNDESFICFFYPYFIECERVYFSEGIMIEQRSTKIPTNHTGSIRGDS